MALDGGTLEHGAAGGASGSSPGYRGRHEPPIRVLLVDDDALVRAGLRLMLGGAPDIEVVGEAADGADGARRRSAGWPGRRADGRAKLPSSDFSIKKKSPLFRAEQGLA